MAEREPPVTVAYVFLTKRPKDHKPWPNAYHERGLAEAAPNRVSAIAEVLFEPNGNVFRPELMLVKDDLARAIGERDEARAQVARLEARLAPADNQIHHPLSDPRGA